MKYHDQALEGEPVLGGGARLLPSLSVRISEAAEDLRWDAFLARSGAHHTQTSAWARVKSGDGWRSLRIVVEQDHVIVAGAQLLFRRAPAIGNVAYLPRGPVTDAGHAAVADRVLHALGAAARSSRIRVVLIEPDVEDQSTLRPAAHRLVPAHQRLSLGATVLVDIARHPDEILAGMRSKTRYNIRRSLTRELTVRAASAGELPIFHRLLVQTGQRQGFEAAPESRYRRWFEILGGEGYLKMFFAEFRGEPVSAMLAVTFGDTVVYKRGAWSGHHGDLRPNEALHWAAMQWGHHAGYRWYDLDGIDRTPAELVLRGEQIPERYLNSVTRFKLGFGGEVVLLPASSAHINGAAPRWLYERAGHRLAGMKRLHRAMAASS